jgi:hypothetical protein
MVVLVTGLQLWEPRVSVNGTSVQTSPFEAAPISGPGPGRGTVNVLSIRMEIRPHEVVVKDPCVFTGSRTLKGLPASIVGVWEIRRILDLRHYCVNDPNMQRWHHRNSDVPTEPRGAA